MRSKVTIFALLIALTLSVVITPSTSNAQAPVKRILLEEYTGCWCGWCPRGIHAIDQMLEKYPGQFIPVSFHNADPMAFATGSDTLESTLPGFPTGWINRKNFTSISDAHWNIDPGTWQDAVTQDLTVAAIAGVTVSEVTYNETTRALSAKVTAKFAQNLTGDIRLNMYVIEDSVSGGTTYDQHNYLTNRAGYSDNPFYNCPAAVSKYQHMHVVRAALGGAYGVAGIIPATANTGASYSATFTYVVPATFNAKHVSVVGYAMQYSATPANNQILNADIAKIISGPAPLATKIAASAPSKYIKATNGGQTTQTITLTNPTASPISAQLAIDKVFTNFPAGWSATITPATIDIAANGTAQATLTFTAPAKSGYISVPVSVLPYNAQGSIGILSTVNINALSQNTKYVSFGSDAAIVARATTTAYGTNLATIPLDEEVMAAYPPESFDVAIFPGIQILDYTTLTGAPPRIIPVITKMLNAGKKVLLTSNYALYWAFESQYASAIATDGLTAFMDKMGIVYGSLTSHLNSSGQLVAASTLTGFAGDPVGDSTSGVTVNNPYYDVFTTINANSKPIFYFDDDETILAGLRNDDGKGGRIVYLDFNLADIATTASQTKIFRKTMDYLLNGEKADVKTVAQNTTGLSVSANPIKNSTVINYNALPTERNVTFSVVDMLGRQVANLTPSSFGNTYSVNFDASDLANGAYVIIAHSSEGTHQIRVVNAQ